MLLFELGRHGFRRILLLTGGGAADQIANYAAAAPVKARFGLDITIVDAVGTCYRCGATAGT